MKKFAVLVLFLFAFFLAGQADADYVSDNLKITVRTGPGTDHKIITMLQASQKVEVLKTSDGWSQIQLSEDKLGWVLSRFLTSDEPCRHIFTKLEKEYAELQKQAVPLFGENKRLKKENKELFAQLAEQTKRAGNLNNELDDIKQNRGYQWFLLGAGVLLLGFLLGFISRHRRQRTFL